MSEALIEALRAAVASAPDHTSIRLELAEALLEVDEPEEALLHARAVLGRAPDDARALGLASRAAEAAGESEVAEGYARLGEALSGGGTEPLLADGPQVSETPSEQETLYVDGDVRVTLADVGGMKEVKRELERSFLGPMRNPALRKHYGAELRGGLLLFGPPGCGKTLLARAVAGELGAQFVSLGLQDVLDMWLGESERKLHSAFQEARRRAPCVLFFDEIDALGQKRGHLRGSAGRNVVNQLLSEMDGIDAGNDDGVFVLAATNHQWDVDSALLRPGRFDRTLLVLPPDLEARAAILELNLRERPTQDIDVAALAQRTEGFSGADLALVCRTAAASVMARAVQEGQPRPIVQADLVSALRETSPSTRAWLQLAYNYAAFANDDGAYDDLLAYIRRQKMV